MQHEAKVSIQGSHTTKTQIEITVSANQGTDPGQGDGPPGGEDQGDGGDDGVLPGP